MQLLCKDANAAGAVLFVALPYQSHLTRAQYRQEGFQWTHLEPHQVRNLAVTFYGLLFAEANQAEFGEISRVLIC